MKFGNRWIISSRTLLGRWLLIHAVKGTLGDLMPHGDKSSIKIRSGVIRRRSNIARYCIQHCSNWDKIYIRVCTHKRHPYLALRCKLWGVNCEDLGGIWSCYNGITLYLDSCFSWQPCRRAVPQEARHRGRMLLEFLHGEGFLRILWRCHRMLTGECTGVVNLYNTLQWRHNGRDGVLNHQPHDSLLNR